MKDRDLASALLGYCNPATRGFNLAIQGEGTVLNMDRWLALIAFIFLCACADRKPPDTPDTGASEESAQPATSDVAKSSGPSPNGPFGVHMGMEISDLPSCTEIPRPGYYECSTVPKMHSSFRTYIVQAVPSVGVCWIKAIGNDVENDAYGVSLRSTADSLADQIGMTYGTEQRKKTDRLLYDSIWSDSDEWTMAVRQNQRFYMYVWDLPPPGKNQVKQIGVLVGATGSDSGQVSVEFSFQNEEQCDDVIKKQEATAF